MKPSEIVGSRLQDEYELQKIHDPVFPADVRQLDRVLGRIKRRGTDANYVDIRIWKISPLGVEFLDEEGKLDLHKGDPIDLQIVVAGHRSLFEGLVVDVVATRGNGFLIGVRLSTSSAPKSRDSGTERRKTTRWICSQEFYPTCVALSPGRFNDYIYFQVRDLSAQGLRLACSLRNKFLLKGMVLKLMMSLPTVGEASAAVRVVRVGISSEGGRDFLVVGAEFVDMSESARSSIAQYLIQFSDVEDLDSLRKQGFVPDSVANGVDFYFLKTEDDYRQVLQLRYEAHLREGNFASGEVVPEDLSDMRDASGRILVGKYHDKVVATGRILFPDTDIPLEQEDYIQWPSALPRRDQLIELGRVCTDPSFRKGDLFARLVQQVTATCVRLERPYVVVVALPHLISLYQKLGCRETGLVHKQEFWREHQHILIVNGYEVCLGKGVNPIVWNYIYKGPFEYLLANGLIQVTGMDRVRITVYRSLSWVSKLAVMFGLVNK